MPASLIGAPDDSQIKQQTGFVVRLLGTNSGVTTAKATGANAKSAGARFGTGLA